MPDVAVGAKGVPVKVGEAIFAFKSNAVCCAVDTGLLASEVLFTLPKPTMVAVIPETVPVKVGEASGAFNASLPSIFCMACKILSVAATVPAPAV